MSPGINGMTAKSDLPTVRRLEAVGFRAWPAALAVYDGSWLIRLTPGHESKRLNSVNPLDPSDCGSIETRLERAARRFADHGLALIIRQTPLAPPELVAHMDAAGWPAFAETIVMTADIPPNDTSEAIEHLPLRDVGRFVDARIRLSGEDGKARPALIEIIQSIKPESGLFLFDTPDDGPTAVSLAVHDSDLAGILQVTVAKDMRRQGVGASIVNASLRWARLRGARKAWLAVECDNAAALGLYRKFGFREAYRYVYRRPAA